MATTAAADWTCTFCLRNFRFRDLFLQHEISCDYFLRRKRIRETDAFEDLPSGQDQFKWIQALAVRIGALERDVARLRASDGTRKRNGIQAWLRNPLCPRPSMTLTEWFDHHLPPLDVGELDDVHKNLVHVMQIIFAEAFRGGSTVDRPPLCAFQGCKTLYAWMKTDDDERQATWIALTGARWDIFFAKFQHRIRKQLQWSNKEEEEEDTREIWMQRLRKVNDVGATQKTAMYAWLRKQLETQNPVV